MENSNLDKLAIVEALLFAANKGLEINQLTDFASCPKNEVLSIIEELKEKYSADGHGVELKKVGKKFGFYTKPKYSESVSRLVRKPIEKLTSSQIEVLAVIAKNGPVKKSQIELVRGKGSDNQVMELMLSGLIKRKRIKGPGRPYAYFVTDSFYETFHLADFEIPKNTEFEDDDAETEEITDTAGENTDTSSELPSEEEKDSEEPAVKSGEMICEKNSVTDTASHEMAALPEDAEIDDASSEKAAHSDEESTESN